VLCYWRHRIPDALAWFKKLAADDNARVRLEAVRGASFFKSVEAADVALAILKHPTDYYLDYTLGETVRQLEPVWRNAITSGKTVAADNPAGSQFLLRTVSTTDLLKLPRSAMVLEALIARADAVDADRMVALGELAKMRNADPVTVLLTEIEEAGNSGDVSGTRPRRRGRVARPIPAEESKTGTVKATVARLLPYHRVEFLKPQRARLEELADGIPATRPAAWAALALADGSFDTVWRQATESPDRLADLLNGIPLLPEADFRAQAYPRVKPLLDEKSPVLSSVADKSATSAVRRAAIRALVSMNHEPQAVFAALTGLIGRNVEVPAAAHGLRVLPRAKWPRTESGGAATALVAWAKTIPTSDRTSSDYCEIVQLAGDLAAALPAEKATALRSTLRELRVSLYVIRAVREQMRYDTPRLVIEAGKAFEIRFENDDFMPHNLVVVKPNTRDQVGVAAATMKPDELDSEGRAFIPKSSDILGASRLLQAGEQQSLKLIAPSVEGEYEYFCTYPGHYQVMWARLVVTKDVDAYLQAHPDVPLPAPSPTALTEDGAKGATHGHSH
jgi:azurin